MVDFFGQIGSATDFAINTTLRRNCTVLAGKTMTATTFDASEWSTQPVDTFGGLDNRLCPGNP
jgi:hypothetical protein